MKNKLIYFRLLIFLLAINISYAQAQNSLIVKFKDSSQSGTLISTLDRITFSGGNLILKKKDTSLGSLLLSEIDKLSFGVFSGVPVISTDATSVQVYPSPATNYIRLKNAPYGEVHITVFRLDGGILINKILSDGTERIDISNLSKGIYLLKVNNKTLKFTKQ